MRITKLIFSGCRWHPPSDAGAQVWIAAIMSRIFNPMLLRKDGTVNRKLSNKVMKKAVSHKESFNGVLNVDFIINPQTGVWCRVYIPTWVDPGKKLPLIIYYPGGGFVLLGPDMKELDLHCRHMSKMCEAIVVSCSYRLAPENKYPTQYEDAFAAVDWLRAQSANPAKDFPINVADFSQVFFCGDSAGGNIAHHVTVRAGAASTDISPLAIAGLILLQPFFGGEERTVSEMRYKHGKFLELTEIDWYWRAFLPPEADRDHPSANVCGPKSPAFLSMNLPKIMVVVGGRDPLQDRQILYAEKMKSAGKECKLVFYEKAFHAFYLFRGVRATTLLHDEIEEFVHPSFDERSMGSRSMDSRSLDGRSMDIKSMNGTGGETVTPRASNASFAVFLDHKLTLAMRAESNRRARAAKVADLEVDPPRQVAEG